MLASCVDVQKHDYPDYLPALTVNAEGCPALSGTFQNRDVESSRLLAAWFVSSKDSMASVDRLDFSAENSGAVRFRFLASDNQVLLGLGPGTKERSIGVPTVRWSGTENRSSSSAWSRMTSCGCSETHVATL